MWRIDRREELGTLVVKPKQNVVARHSLRAVGHRYMSININLFRSFKTKILP